MHLSDLILQARQGDCAAIAAILAQALKLKPKQLQVHLKQGYLTIVLYKSVPRPATLAIIQQALQPIGRPTVQIVKVYAQNSPTASPLWVTEFHLAPLNPRSTRPVQQSRPQAPFNLPSWIAEKPDPSRWAKQLHDRFYPLQLVIVLLLALYGIFGSHSYSVEAFLDGPDGISNFMHGVNLIFHEAGHMLFLPFGEFMHFLGGSLNQILIPALISGYFFWTGQKFSGAVCLCWTGENFWDVSVYVKDASLQELPLLGGEGVMHDWNTLLGWMGLLRFDHAIGNFLFAIGSLLYIAAIALGIYHSRRRPPTPPNPPNYPDLPELPQD